MMIRQTYCYVSNENSLNHFPDNHAGEFKVKLAERLILEGEWVCALTEFQYTVQTPPLEALSEIYVCSNLCDSSLVGGVKLSVLRKIPNLIQGEHIVQTFDPAFYIPVIQRDFSVIDIYLKDKNFQSVSFDSGSISCTLHFKRQSPFYWE